MKKFLSVFLFSLFTLLSTSLYAQEKKGVNTQDDNAADIEITVTGNIVKIKNATVGKFLDVYSVVGKKIESVEIKSSTEECTLHVPKGLYILKIEDTIRKVVIK